MVRTRALRFLLILGLVALLLPVSLAHADGHPRGTATVRDAVILGDPFAGDTPTTVASGMLVISMSGVAAPEEETVLEGWLVSDDGERKQSVGILEVSAEGTISSEVAEDLGENLFEAFNTFVITVEPAADDDPGPSAEIVYKGSVASEVLEQVRLLLLPSETPGAAVSLRTQADMAADSAGEAQAAANKGDLEMAREHIDCMLAIIQGSEVCGDGVGITAHADSVAAAANAAGQAAPDDDAVAAASEATQSAANAVKSSSNEAIAAAALATAATSTQVVVLHVGNVVADIEAAAGSAGMAYTGTQDLGTYSVGVPIPLPPTGEPVIAQMVRYGFIGSIMLVLLGSMMFFATRRRSGGSAV